MREMQLFGIDVIRHVTDGAAGEELANDRGAERAGAAGNDNVTFAKISHSAYPRFLSPDVGRQKSVQRPLTSQSP